MNKFSKFTKGYIQAAVGPALAHIQKLIANELQPLKILSANTLVNQIHTHGIYPNIQDAEFQVFSQFGDDGILQYLIYQTKPGDKRFIEFGVESYVEANTRFLLMNNITRENVNQLF